MSRTGVNQSINLSKLDKSKLFKGKDGSMWANLTSYLDTEKDQYDNNGSIQQSLSKEEREQGIKAPYIGNNKIFWTDSSNPEPKPLEPTLSLEDEDLPF